MKGWRYPEDSCVFSTKWKFLVLSIVVYQVLLTWCLFGLVDTAAYLARPHVANGAKIACSVSS